jgi:hypothetical protein
MKYRKTLVTPCLDSLGMTKVKVGKDDSSSADFVERRRAALER